MHEKNSGRAEKISRKKIFGVGIQRTGCSSLCEALRLLGFRSVQWPAGLFQNLDHPILNEFDAFTDNPIPIIYQQLDKMFPGSKFILTIRDTESWLKSVQWLFNVGEEEFNWNEYPVTHQMHKALYGTTQFDKQIFRNIYQNHNDEVRRYFAQRPLDLLVINFRRKEGWSQLCRFLDRPVPDVPIPIKNKSSILRTAKIKMRAVHRRVSHQ
jgi:hypothetical protein